jgi:hypothetical protein
MRATYRWLLLGVTALALGAVYTVLWVSSAQAANIIVFGDAPGKCGGAVLCSSSTGPLAPGTQGYLNNGTGGPFDLSTITQWFQIDPTGKSYLPDQPAEPDKGAGQFLVVNNTGAPVNSFSLTLNDTFTSSTPSVGALQGRAKRERVR